MIDAELWKKLAHDYDVAIVWRFDNYFDVYDNKTRKRLNTNLLRGLRTVEVFLMNRRKKCKR